MSIRSNIFLKSFCYIILVFLYCEFLIYYVVLVQCDWPTLDSHIRIGNDRPVYAIFLADTHLLGRRNGHWFDKLRREWQMHRAFQTAMTLHRPQLVFVLGDLFDEGLWCSGEEFNDYVDRFFTLFKVPYETKLYIVAGNHDIGFHYNVSPYLAGRFARKMDGPPVQMVTVRGNHFVLINSMAMEGDGCFLCQNATSAVNNITSTLRCMKGTSTRNCDHLSLLERYSRPILLQHFPMYRISDEVCTESDAVPLAERSVKFRERWDCLSRESTEYLVDSLEPRVVLGGHTHHACYITHSVGTPGPDLKKMVEYSVPSFSWRNRDNPSFMLGVFTPDKYKISKCFMPKESTVIRLYIIFAVAFVAFIAMYLKRTCRFRRTYYRKESYH